jgi:hypothetical protein
MMMIVPFIGLFPMPVMGYGISPIIGYLISITWLHQNKELSLPPKRTTV